MVHVHSSDSLIAYIYRIFDGDKLSALYGFMK